MLPSRAKQQELGSIDQDPHVEAAIEHMEQHAEQLDNQPKQPFDALLEEYSATLGLLESTVEPATRVQLEGQKNELREKLRDASQFDMALDKELDGATQREAALHDQADTLLTKHELKEDQKPQDPETQQAKMMIECRRVMLFAGHEYKKAEEYIGHLTQATQPKELLRLENFQLRLLRATEELSASKLDSRFPEKISLEVWNSALTKLQDVFEEILLATRDIAQQAVQQANMVSRAPKGSIRKA